MEQIEIHPTTGHACALITFLNLLDPYMIVYPGQSRLEPEEVIDLKEKAWELERSMRRIYHIPCDPLEKEWPLPEILQKRFWEIAERVDFVISGEAPEAQSIVLSFPERCKEAWRLACFGAYGTA